MALFYVKIVKYQINNELLIDDTSLYLELYFHVRVLYYYYVAVFKTQRYTIHQIIQTNHMTYLAM